MLRDSAAEEPVLRDLEARVAELPNVLECRVLRHADGFGSRVVAYVVASAAFSGADANRRLLQQAPERTLPDTYALVTALPRTAAGVVDVAALTALPVVDEALALQVEEQLRADPRIASAVVLADQASRSAPALPVARLMSLRQRTVEAREAPAVRATSVTRRPSGPLALRHGPELVSLPDSPRTLTDSLERAATSVDVPAIVYLGDDGSPREQSFAALRAEALAIAAGLVRAGVMPGQHVLLQLSRPEQVLPAFWACLYRGAVPAIFGVPAGYSPLTNEFARLCGVLELLQSPFVLTSSQLRDSLRAASRELGIDSQRLLVLEDLCATSAELSAHRASPDDVAFMTFTSGSTGLPKGIPLSHANVLARARGANLACGNHERDVVFNWLPFDHIGSISDWHLRCVELRCRMVYACKELVLGDALNWLRVMDRYRVSHSWAPNFAYRLVSAALAGTAERWDLSCVQTLLSAGEAVSSSTVQEFTRQLALHGLPRTALRPAFGMAELASGVNYYQPTPERPTRVRALDRDSLDGALTEVASDDPRAIGVTSLGPIIPGASMRIVDEHNRVLPELTVGRLQIAGGPVFRGYYKNPGANQLAFTEDGWFDTGDRGFIAEAELYLTGRDKETLVINGANFSNAEIEAVVEQIPGVVVSFTAACAVRPEGASGEQLAIFFVPVRARGPELAALLKRIQSSVLQKTGAKPDYLLPVSRDEIPKTAIGKLQRKQLVRRFESGAFRGTAEASCSLLEGPDTIPDWFLTPAFLPRARRSKPAQPGRGFLLIEDEHGLSRALADELSASAATIWRTTAAEATSAFLAAGTALSDVLDLRSFGPLGQEARGRDGAPTLAEHTAATLAAMIDPIRALGQMRRAEGPPVRYLVVASHAQRVRTSDQLDPARAAAPALLRAIEQELPAVRCRHVDVPFGEEELVRVAQRLALEAYAEPDEPEVAYRGDQRSCTGFERVRWPAVPEDSRLRSAGVYVLTGGLGGVGVALARYLLEHLRATVLLVGRSESSAVESELRVLRQLGSVRYAVADVSRPRALERAVADFERDCGQPVDGFFHLASSYSEGSTLEESSESLARQFAAKVDGAIAVGDALAQRPQAFAVHFSSVASRFGGSGLGVYAAANRVLDAIAAEQRRHGLQSYAVNWSVWDGLGLGARTAPSEVLRAKGLSAIASGRGMASLAALLARPADTVVVGVDVQHRALMRLIAGSAQPAASLRGIVELARSPGGGPSEPVSLPSGASDCLGNRLELELWEVETTPRSADGTADRTVVARLLHGGAAREQSPATTDLEQRLVEIWKLLLGVHELGIDEHFFDLGGTSLLAVRLFAEIEKQLGPSLPLATLFRAGTVRGLSQALEEQLSESSAHSADAASGRFEITAFRRKLQDRQSALVLIQAGRTVPFFCVHGAGGNVLNFRDIARRLGPDQTFYGLQAQGVDGSKTQSTIEEMAESYVAEILRLEPNGPYLLAGYSTGGVVAFEMARQLRAAGHEVPVLALLDTFCAGVVPLSTSFSDHVKGLLEEGPRYLVRRALASLKRQWDFLAAQLKVRLHRLRRQPLPFELREHSLARGLGDAAERYRPSRFEGPALLYRAALVDPPFRHVGDKRGWDEFLPDLEVIEVPGDHANFLMDPNVSVMTAHLAHALRAAEQRAEAPERALAMGENLRNAGADRLRTSKTRKRTR
ncbi:MAG TPA: SDR family NAD(P)-dependent oxidoreductase [Polyangiaceae bacterium]|nr:SDR family NAD(P)-dependent oxidoreductase [Polyangiaceae bacterium]